MKPSPTNKVPEATPGVSLADSMFPPSRSGAAVGSEPSAESRYSLKVGSNVPECLKEYLSTAPEGLKKYLKDGSKLLDYLIGSLKDGTTVPVHLKESLEAGANVLSNVSSTNRRDARDIGLRTAAKIANEFDRIVAEPTLVLVARLALSNATRGAMEEECGRLRDAASKARIAHSLPSFAQANPEYAEYRKRLSEGQDFLRDKLFLINGSCWVDPISNFFNRAKLEALFPPKQFPSLWAFCESRSGGAPEAMNPWDVRDIALVATYHRVDEQVSEEKFGTTPGVGEGHSGVTAGWIAHCAGEYVKFCANKRLKLPAFDEVRGHLSKTAGSIT